MLLTFLTGLLIFTWLATAAVVLFKFFASRDAGYLVLGVGLVIFPFLTLATGPIMQLWIDSASTPPLGMSLGEFISAFSITQRILSSVVLLAGVLMLKTHRSENSDIGNV